MRPAVIALVGIDGSGKTTQAHRLADWLTASGEPATYWQNAGGRRWFGRLAQRFGRPDAQALLGRRAMLGVEATLRWLAIARALVRSQLTGRVAVMDRYAVCQYASIRAHSRRRERLARLAYAVFPPPDVTFLLVVRPAEAYRRIELRGADHERYRFLAGSAAAYEALPEAATFVRIDGEGTQDEVQQALRRVLRPERKAVAGVRSPGEDHDDPS